MNGLGAVNRWFWRSWNSRSDGEGHSISTWLTSMGGGSRGSCQESRARLGAGWCGSAPGLSGSGWPTRPLPTRERSSIPYPHLEFVHAGPTLKLMRSDERGRYLPAAFACAAPGGFATFSADPNLLE